jgi:hypothetical protein
MVRFVLSDGVPLRVRLGEDSLLRQVHQEHVFRVIEPSHRVQLDRSRAVGQSAFRTDGLQFEGLLRPR